MIHWAEQYVGTPWVKGGNDLDGFDCWGFVRYVQKKHFGILVPIIDVDAHNIRAVMKAFKTNPELKKWERIDKPVDGSAVLLSQATNPSHVGVWINVDGGGLLHCVQGMGVIFSTLRNLQNAGWSNIRYYEHIETTE